MSFPYVIYRRATGEIVARIVAPTADQLPPEGLWGDWDDTWIKHGDCDIAADRVRVAKRGKTEGTARIVPKTKAQMADETGKRAWFEFRRQRNVHFGATDHMMTEDFPISAEEKAALIAKRKASRELPQTMKDDPEGALRALAELWSEPDGME